MKKVGIAVPYVTLKDGKLVRVHKIPAGQKKNAHAKSARLAKAWKGKSK